MSVLDTSEWMLVWTGLQEQRAGGGAGTRQAHIQCCSGCARPGYPSHSALLHIQECPDSRAPPAEGACSHICCCVSVHVTDFNMRNTNDTFINKYCTALSFIMNSQMGRCNTGLLQFPRQEGEDWVALTAGRNCSQDSVDMNLLRYLHRKQHGAKSQDSFTFYLLDGENPSAPEHFHISVKHQEKSHFSVLSS